jgi:hypothetical protein
MFYPLSNSLCKPPILSLSDICVVVHAIHGEIHFRSYVNQASLLTNTVQCFTHWVSPSVSLRYWVWVKSVKWFMRYMEKYISIVMYTRLILKTFVKGVKCEGQGAGRSHCLCVCPNELQFHEALHYEHDLWRHRGPIKQFHGMESFLRSWQWPSW